MPDDLQVTAPNNARGIVSARCTICVRIGLWPLPSAALSGLAVNLTAGEVPSIPMAT
jgi:hypothetical protein